MSENVVVRHSRNNLFTRGECEKILENYLAESANGKGELLSYEIEPELGSVGYLGEYFHLNLCYQLENSDILHKMRLFVKSMPYQCADMSFFIEKSGILKKEAQLYDTLLNELRKLSANPWCAQCYFTRKDLFVMQNIVDMGYEPLKEPTAFLTEKEIKPLLKGLAIMHACSIAYEQRNNVNIGEKLKDSLFEVTVSPTVDWYTTGIRAVLAIIEQHPSYQKAEVREFVSEKLPALLETVYEMVNPSTKYRNVFCHRDPWGGNVFYSQNADAQLPAVFVDFQLCRYSPPAIDVLMAMYLNLKPKARRLIMDQCCLYYYEHFAQQLSSMGVEASEHMTLADFESSMHEFELYGALYNCMAATILRVPDNYLKDMKQKCPQAYHRYANVERTDTVLALIRAHQGFRQYMFDCVRDLMELVLA